MNSILLAASKTVSDGIGIIKPLYHLFGKCMGVLMELLGNQYFIALVIFTFLTRILLLPINIRQQKTMAKTTRLQPKIKKIQNKYPDPKDRAKLNQEMQDLYAREGHNPMQMGCLPMMFQMLFLMGIIGIIYYPFSYVLSIPGFNDNQQAIYDIMLPIYREFIGDAKANMTYFQLELLGHFDMYKDALTASDINVFTTQVCSEIEKYRQGMNLFGLDMTAFPHWKDGVIVIIPILSFVTSLGSSVISTVIQKKNNPAASQQMGSMVMMMLMMPFFSFYISFKVTAAVGFYWIISNLVAILQQLFIAKYFPPRKSQARLMIENTIERRSREENIKKIKE